MSTSESQNLTPFEQKLDQEGVDFTITDAIPIGISVLAPDGTTLFMNRQALDHFGLTLDEVKGKGHLARTCHPDHLDRILDERRMGLSNGVPFALEMRLLFKNGEYRWLIVQYNPLKDESGNVIRWYVTETDIDDRKQAEERLRAAEFSWRQAVDNIPGFVWQLSATGEVEIANRQLLAYFGRDFEDLKNWATSGILHPEDLPHAIEVTRHSFATGDPYELELRPRRFDGVYRWFQVRGNPECDAEGRILHWYVLCTDIDDRKRAEEKVRQSEQDLLTITDSIANPIAVLAPDGAMLYANRVTLNHSGLSFSEAMNGFYPRSCHPDDIERAQDERQRGLREGVPFELEMRLLKHGEYRWQLAQYNPLKDERGHIIRWYVSATDIDDRKKTEERLQNENLVLREEIDRSSMFEEIVGSSRPTRQVLKQVEKVAPADSTVLILGETGTGKELIARALHRRSKRANRAFVQVNCASIPQSLIASELFGHEKGAFTGALQRRVGRFEAADGGTLFLDEVGDLPMETQLALLRVLQERQFERVGANQPVKIDVRLIAATNRDLTSAVAAGTFRQDLFYRLNVFPISVPPLRDRVDDIPLLVEYFLGRYAKGAGKNVRHIAKQTLDLLKAYHWPGNIRELQNVVERAVIICEDETFVVDESWLRSDSADSSPQRGRSALADREIETIEAALAECHGRISGPSGAAAKLGIPRQTLESKIRRLGIDRYGQKRPASN